MEAHITEKKSDEVPEERPWSVLPDDILLLIINALDLVDRLHLALSCKRYLTTVRSAPPQNGLLLGSPCLLLIANGSKTCSLINPLHKEKYSLNTRSLPSKVEILFSKDGWLLMVSQVDRQSIFFFNPWSKAKIDLPELDFRPCCAFSFTSPPTSPDCLVVAVNAVDDRAYIFTCRRGDTLWTSKVYFHDDEILFDMSYTNPVFHKERFYCLGNNGMLGIYNPVEETWDVMKKPGPEKLNTHRVHLVESDGELFRVHARKNGDSIRVHKLDPVTNKWRAVESIGDDRQFYVGGVGSISSKAVSSYGGMIYFRMLRDEDFVFYSCETRELHPGKNFHGVKDFPLACWIEPQWIKPSPEELHWSLVW